MHQRRSFRLIQTGEDGGKDGLRFSRCDASPSRASGPVKPSISKAVEASKAGPIMRSQLFSAYLVHRSAEGAPTARRDAISSALV